MKKRLNQTLRLGAVAALALLVFAATCIAGTPPTNAAMVNSATVTANAQFVNNVDATLNNMLNNNTAITAAQNTKSNEEGMNVAIANTNNTATNTTTTINTSTGNQVAAPQNDWATNGGTSKMPNTTTATTLNSKVTHDVAAEVNQR